MSKTKSMAPALPPLPPLPQSMSGQSQKNGEPELREGNSAGTASSQAQVSEPVSQETKSPRPSLVARALARMSQTATGLTNGFPSLPPSVRKVIVNLGRCQVNRAKTAHQLP